MVSRDTIPLFAETDRKFNIFPNRKLPHSVLPDPADICLIVKDLEKGLKVDHEPSTHHFRQLLSDKGVGPELVAAVMPLRELKVEYKQFETKTALCHKYDLFLADDRIVKFLPKFLGKPFYKRKKFPVPVSHPLKITT
jgi:ribosome biogenesis protein UTP30